LGCRCGPLSSGCGGALGRRPRSARASVLGRAYLHDRHLKPHAHRELKEGEIEVVIPDGKGTHRDRVRLALDGTLIEQAREEAKAKA
jgi:hypothetical protein